MLLTQQIVAKGCFFFPTCEMGTFPSVKWIPLWVNFLRCLLAESKVKVGQQSSVLHKLVRLVWLPCCLPMERLCKEGSGREKYGSCFWKVPPWGGQIMLSQIAQ